MNSGPDPVFFGMIVTIMGKNKLRWCNVYEDRHVPPTGKKCVIHEKVTKQTPQVSKLMDKASFDGSTCAESDSSQDIVVKTKKCAVIKMKAQVGGQNSKVNGATAPWPYSTSEDEQQNQEHSLDGDVQVLILQELRRVNSRLDTVEEQIAGNGMSSSTMERKGQKLNKTSAHNSCTGARHVKQ